MFITLDWGHTPKPQASIKMPKKVCSTYSLPEIDYNKQLMTLISFYIFIYILK